MTTMLREKALVLLRQTLNNPNADFRDAQWEAIEELLLNKSRLLVVQRTGWGKSLVYFLATRLISSLVMIRIFSYSVFITPAFP
jgi:ATP-dependent DNA helicase RecQ